MFAICLHHGSNNLFVEATWADSHRADKYRRGNLTNHSWQVLRIKCWFSTVAELCLLCVAEISNSTVVGVHPDEAAAVSDVEIVRRDAALLRQERYGAKIGRASPME